MTRLVPLNPAFADMTYDELGAEHARAWAEGRHADCVTCIALRIAMKRTERAEMVSDLERAALRERDDGKLDRYAGLRKLIEELTVPVMRYRPSEIELDYADEADAQGVPLAALLNGRTP